MRLRLERSTSIILMIIYFLALIYVVFLEPTRGAGEHYAPPRWMPLESTFDFIMQAEPTYRYWGFFALNLLGNVIMFMPFGFLCGVLSDFPVNRLRIVLAAFFLSLGIELLQLVFRIGVYDADDILLNVLGAWLGLCLYQLLVARNIVQTYKNS